MDKQGLIDFFTHQLTLQQTLAAKNKLPKAAIAASSVKEIKGLSIDLLDLAEHILTQLSQPEFSHENDDFMSECHQFYQMYSKERHYFAAVVEFILPKTRQELRFKDMPADLSEMIQQYEMEHPSLQDDDDDDLDDDDLDDSLTDEAYSAKENTSSIATQRPTIPILRGHNTFFSQKPSVEKPLRDVEKPLRVELLLKKTLESFLERYVEILAENTSLREQLGLPSAPTDDTLAKEMQADKSMSRDILLKHQIHVVSRYCLLLENENNELQQALKKNIDDSARSFSPI